MTTQNQPLSNQPERGRPHSAADWSTIIITSGINETYHLTTEGGAAAGPPLQHPAMFLHPHLPLLQQSPLTAAASAAAPLTGGTNVIVATTGGVHDTDMTTGMIPLFSPPWHALHLSQDTYRTVFTEVSMCLLTSCCCLKAQFQSPTLRGNPVRANVRTAARLKTLPHG